MDNLVDASVRRRLVKTLPEYAGIDPMPTNNAPTVPQGDGEKAAWDRQVRVVQRLVVTLYLVIGQDKAVDAMEAEYSTDELFELLFAFLSALSRDISASKKQVVDRRFKPTDPTPLLKKDNLKNLMAANAVGKELRGSLTRTAPYPSPYRLYGGPRRQGKGGKGRGKAGCQGKCQHRQRFTFRENKLDEVTK